MIPVATWAARTVAKKVATKAATQAGGPGWWWKWPAGMFAGLFLMVPPILAGFGGGAWPSGAGICGPGDPVHAERSGLDAATVERINALKALYEEAAERNDVAWPALAAVDYRESNNDPGRSALAGEPLGTSNPDHPEITLDTKAQSLDAAAEYLRGLGKSVYGVEITAASPQEDLAWAFLAYNRGFIYQRADAPYDWSPYVMNQIDAEHVDMTWPDIPGEPLAGRKEIGRYGALTIFVRLGGEALGACGSPLVTDRRFVEPIPGAPIASPYGMRRHPIHGDMRLHTGVDYSAPMGRPIRAAGSGTVTRAGWFGGYGTTVEIDHGGGLSTLYAHQSAVVVFVGDPVTQGETIGYVGSTGQSTGPHLHWEVRLHGQPQDPMPYLDQQPEDEAA